MDALKKPHVEAPSSGRPHWLTAAEHDGPRGATTRSSAAQSFGSLAEAAGAVLDLLAAMLPQSAIFIAHRDEIDDVIGVIDARPGAADELDFGLPIAFAELQAQDLDWQPRDTADDDELPASTAPLRIGAYDYVGIPLALIDGSRVGTLCIVSRQGSAAAASDFSLLVRTLARLLASELEREHSERSLLRRAHTLVQVNAELSVHAETDPLTGLPNRRAFDRTLSTRWLESVSTDTAASLGIFDLNDFKAINDTLGHKTGDFVLCAAANAFSKACRGGDTISRIGGDEFAVILAGCSDQRGCVEFAQRANERLLEDLRDSGVHATLSEGFAQLADFPSAEAAFEAADRAMYGKKRGRRLE